MPDYRRESEALDAEVLGVIERWHRRGAGLDDAGFNDLALRLFDYQRRYNAPYGRYCEALGLRSPASWEAIAGVPVAAYKEATLATFDPREAALVFETSGTTVGRPGRHYMQTAALYDAALLAGFDRFVLRGRAPLRYFNLVPNPAKKPQSSLGYMMTRVAKERGAGETGWYVSEGELLVTAFIEDLRSAIERKQPVCIAATSFSLVQLLDALESRRRTFELPSGSCIMTTGGFKGRSRTVESEELDGRTTRLFGISGEALVAEYGMTELSSQYYAWGGAAYAAPPWLRTRTVAYDRTTLPPGEVGSLLHVDLANRSSCIAIQTEDLGILTGEGLTLVGRDRDAPLRGCSLDAEELRSAAQAASQ